MHGENMKLSVISFHCCLDTPGTYVYAYTIIYTYSLMLCITCRDGVLW